MKKKQKLEKMKKKKVGKRKSKVASIDKEASSFRVKGYLAVQSILIVSKEL